MTTGSIDGMFSAIRSAFTATVTKIKEVLTAAADRLAGEPARVIGYGSAVIVYLVANASGRIPDVTLDEAVVRTTVAITIIASVVESIRHFVYSPPSVGQIIDEANADWVDLYREYTRLTAEYYRLLKASYPPLTESPTPKPGVNADAAPGS